MSNVNSRGKAMLTNIGKRPAATVPLAKPITFFAIPLVNAEWILDESATEVSYRAPEVTDVIDFASGEKFQTCRVPVVKGKRVTGYVPLPMRYVGVWLQLSYTIVLYTHMWRLWSEEEEESTRKTSKAKAAILRQNSGAMVAQHMLARLLAVDELVSLSHDTTRPGEEHVRILDEWKIRWTRDWFTSTYDDIVGSGAKFLNADPVSPENQELFEGDWNIHEEGIELLRAPENLKHWFYGEINGLDRLFATKLKKQALASLKPTNDYSQRQYSDEARLPARWHEGHQPTPYFWTVKQWTWVAEGNNLWEKPIDLLYYCITADPPYTHSQQLMRELNSLLSIIVRRPRRQEAESLLTQLWTGEMTWREFVDALMQDHFDNVDGVIAQTSEKRDPENVFNTLEARLVLEGYIRRQKEAKNNQPWDVKDDILWNALGRVAPMKYKSGWEWIILQIVSNQKVTEVLQAAGPWWKKSQLAGKQRLQNAAAEQAEEDNHDDNADATGDPDPDVGSQQQASVGPSGPDIQMQEGDNPDNGRPNERPQDTVMEDIVKGSAENGVAQGPAENGMVQGLAEERTEGTAGQDQPRHPHSSIPTDLPGPPTPPLTVPERIALYCYEQFRKHKSVDQLESNLQEAFPADHSAIIKQFIDTLRVWNLITADPPLPALHTFVQGLRAIEARQESERVQDSLL
ncbi:hypothetical protein DEU56DRAFT_760667 [Suillus clintonianus]|uniref:uncharacterized protein n=1 Tax=Suillus clintonianus TaxID=1904413 RepID=UPI001B86B435|nr:uncharacterized protein DEU56DRAFT_762559 [Suillus clintonianus]XP_041202902.1 uncharacterized protein DEU56DRAFT_760667 [Suillus clintonianus]KAG2108284.1 hypothetical protein DEU56DRAFT_762559 [Suillus clintonianus]KAG2121489.1 hypothetical protein DEU56DRAFT_760667 [Suillus clintonianus]